MVSWFRCHTAALSLLVAVASLPLEFHGQYGQDRVIFERFFAEEAADAAAGNQRAGVFLEMGAGDGLKHSNTLAFERILGWTGILIEPFQRAFDLLERNRPNCHCLHTCVAEVAGNYDFLEDGWNSRLTQSGKGHKAKQWCKTLTQILDDYFGGPGTIDFLSLDIEGGEFELLRSLDFTRHNVEIITVEVKTEPERRSVSDLLRSRHFTFVERLVSDDIYVKRRGLYPDPSCYYPQLRLRESLFYEGEWSEARSLLQKLEHSLQGMSMSLSPSERLSSLNMNESFNLIGGTWTRLDAPRLESNCPAGMLAIGLAMVILNNRETLQAFDHFGIVKEFLRHVAFFSPARLPSMVDTFDRDAAVAAAERRADHFAIFLPLGRPWHETSFIHVIESGWPIFGFLDYIARLFAQMDTLYDGAILLRRAAPPCKMEVDAISGELSLRMTATSVLHKSGKARPPGEGNVRRETNDLIEDSAMCGLMGSATLRFHEAKMELEREQWRHVSESYVPMINWTSSCRSRRSLGPNAKTLCSEQSLRSCAAIDGSKRRVSQACLRIHRAPGRSLFFRHRHLLPSSRVVALLEDGEQLVREVVRRYGLFASMWVLNSPAFVAPGVTGAFGTLQAIQDGFHSKSLAK